MQPVFVITGLHLEIQLLASVAFRSGYINGMVKNLVEN